MDPQNASQAEAIQLIRGLHRMDTAIHVPAMVRRDAAQFDFGLGQSYVKGRLPLANTFKQEAESKGCLAGAGRALNQIDAFRLDPPAENDVEASSPDGKLQPGWLERRLIYSRLQWIITPASSIPSCGHVCIQRG